MNECSKTWLSRGTLVPNKKYSEAKEQPKILFSYNSTKCGYWKWSQTCHKRQDFPQLLCWRLASTGYHKMPKMPSTGWITRGHLFLTGVEAGESKIKVPASARPDEVSLSGLQTATFLLHPCTGDVGREYTLGFLLIKVLIPITRAPPHNLI